MHSCDCRNEGAPPPVFFFGGGRVPSAPGAPRKVSVPPNLASATADPHLNGTVVKYLAALHTCDAASFEAVWHPEGQLLGLAADGGLLLLDADEYKEVTLTPTLTPTLTLTLA